MAWARASSKPGFQNPSKVQRTLGEPWFLQGSDTRMQMRKQTEFKENGGGWQAESCERLPHSLGPSEMTANIQVQVETAPSSWHKTGQLAAIPLQPRAPGVPEQTGRA